MTKQKLNQLVKEMSRHVGLGPERYSTHSFRIGAATTAAAAQIPDWKIRMLGRWLSDSYLLYIRTPREQLRTISSVLATTPIFFSEFEVWLPLARKR